MPETTSSETLNTQQILDFAQSLRDQENASSRHSVRVSSLQHIQNVKRPQALRILRDPVDSANSEPGSRPIRLIFEKTLDEDAHRRKNDDSST